MKPPERDTGSAARSGEDLTTLQLRRARDGDTAALGWIVERFTPLLRIQASYRLGARLRSMYDPDDVVNDAWAVTLPRLASLGLRDGRATPVVLRFLATTVLHRVNDLVKKHMGGGPRVRPSDSDPGSALAALPASMSGVLTRAARNEAAAALAAALDDLDPIDRQVLILRGIEQNANATVAMLLKLEPNTVSMRFRRALDRIRMRLPRSIVNEILEV